VARLAALYVGFLDDVGLEGVTVIRNSIGGWIAAEIAPLDSRRITCIVLLDAVGIEVDGHPSLTVTVYPYPRFRHSRSTTRRLSESIPAPSPMPKTIMAANRAPLDVDADSPAKTEPNLLDRLGGITVRTLVLWGESHQIAEPAYGQALPPPSTGRSSRCCPLLGTCPR
jgi:pimeloyl-ACP methyl ester carboxylesterase